MIKVESNFNPQALSPKGAMGIMQLMPETAKKNGVSDAFDPQDNIEGGIRYFNKLMIMFNNRLTLALAGYNAGENAVIKYGYKIPPYPETINYVEKVYTHYDNLRDKKVKRNIKAMVAERFDKKKPGKKKSGSFLYVETLESETFASYKPGRKAAPQKPKIILKPKTRSNVSAASANAVYGDSHTGNKNNKVAGKGGRYTVQIVSFPDKRFAKEMESTLKSRTYPAYVQKADIPGKGTWYRVRVGKFSTKEEARQYANDIKTSEPSINSVYVALN